MPRQWFLGTCLTKYRWGTNGFHLTKLTIFIRTWYRYNLSGHGTACNLCDCTGIICMVVWYAYSSGISNRGGNILQVHPEKISKSDRINITLVRKVTLNAGVVITVFLFTRFPKWICKYKMCKCYSNSLQFDAINYHDLIVILF